MINNVVLVGRLTKEIDLRYTESGTAVGNFTLAVNRQFTNQQGEREADFINCVAWRKTAEIIANYTAKGSMIGIQGNIQTRSYDNNEGKRVYVTEVVAQSVSLLENKKTNEGNQQNSNKTNKSNSNFNNKDPFDKSSQPIDISDDDLPF